MEIKDYVGITLGTMAAIISFWQARRTSHQVSSAIVMKFLEEYSSQEMRDAITEMEEFYSKESQLIGQLNMLLASCYNQKIVEEHLALLHSISNDYCVSHEKAIGRSRSKIAWFFHKAWRLYNHGFINKRTLKTILSLDGHRVFVTVACPLTLAIRFSKIHNGNIETYLKDHNVLWYRKSADFSHKRKKLFIITTKGNK